MNDRFNGRFTNLRRFLSEKNIKPYNDSEAKVSVAFIGEGGVGDEIVFFRMGKVLSSKLDINLVYFSTNNLSDIFNHNREFQEYHNIDFEYNNGVYNFNTKHNTQLLSVFDYYISPIGIYFGLDQNNLFDFSEDLAWKGTYLTTKKIYDNKWHSLIDSDKIKIGIKFSGTPSLENQLKRNIPFEKLYELFDPEIYELYSFQRDECTEIIQSEEYSDVIDLSKKLETWDDTLSAISQMDIMISSCTSVAHVAGALNKTKTFILIPNNEHTYKIWEEPINIYSTNTTIIKQKNINDWSYPLQRLSELLNLKPIVRQTKTIMGYY